MAAVAGPRECAAGVMDQLCTSLTNFLNEESTKADADAKACKKNCGWKKRKDDLLDSARKKAKESCSKGEAPDATELGKGLDRNTKDRLKDLYDRNSRMFDGKAKLEAANFGAVSSKDAAITGKGGQVTDLKSSEPDIPKLSAVSEFSLVGTKLSGEPSGPSSAEQSTVLPAAPAQKTGATAAASLPGQVVIPEIPQINIPEIPDIPDPAWYEHRKDYCTMARSLPALLDAQKAKLSEEIAKFKAAYAQIDLTILPPAAKERLTQQYNTIIVDAGNVQIRLALAKKSMEHDIASYCSGKENWFTRLMDWADNLWHRKDEKCGDGWYNPSKECCIDKAKVSQQSCDAESVEIAGQSDLILYNPAKNSKPVLLSFHGPKECPCSKPKTIQWALSSKKVEFEGVTNKATVRIKPVSESEAEDDISVTVTVDGVTSAPKKLTVRRPERLSHPPLIAETAQGKQYIRVFTDSSFRWTLVDQLGKPLANAPVNMDVIMNAGAGVYEWEDLHRSGISDINGHVPDQYYIDTTGQWIESEHLYAMLSETLTVAGWPGTSQVHITVSPGAYIEIAGESPVELLPLP